MILTFAAPALCPTHKEGQTLLLAQSLLAQQIAGNNTAFASFSSRLPLLVPRIAVQRPQPSPVAAARIALPAAPLIARAAARPPLRVRHVLRLSGRPRRLVPPRLGVLRRRRRAADVPAPLRLHVRRSDDRVRTDRALVPLHTLCVYDEDPRGVGGAMLSVAAIS